VDLTLPAGVVEVDPDDSPAETPWLPAAETVELPGRGTLQVRQMAGPPGAPTIVLLHGWTATADLNWYRCYAPLGERYRVIAYDHRGHGTGLRTRKSFRLEDCADDAVAIADALGVETFVPVGYSMGGAVAQLIWRQHRERISGLVLCATAPRFADRRDERLGFLGITGLAALARVTPGQARDWLTEQLYLQRKTALWEPWAIRQAATHDWRMILEAGRAIGSYSARDWVAEIDRPTSLVITLRDRVVPLERQLELFDRIAHAQTFRLDAEHNAAVTDAERFVPSLLRAIRTVMAPVTQPTARR